MRSARAAHGGRYSDTIHATLLKHIFKYSQTQHNDARRRCWKSCLLFARSTHSLRVHIESRIEKTGETREMCQCELYRVIARRYRRVSISRVFRTQKLAPKCVRQQSMLSPMFRHRIIQFSMLSVVVVVVFVGADETSARRSFRVRCSLLVACESAASSHSWAHSISWLIEIH